jgi:hypothetical protein
MKHIVCALLLGMASALGTVNAQTLRPLTWLPHLPLRLQWQGFRARTSFR